MSVITSEVTAREWTLDVITDERVPFFFQIPTVAVHRSVLAALDIPEFCLVRLRRVSTNQTQAVWLVGDDDELWESCPTAWHATARLSNAAWRAYGAGTIPRSGERLQLSHVSARMPAMPAHIEDVLPGDEVGLHRLDAATLGIGRWALLNHTGIPAVCRVRLLDEDRDRGVIRLSYQGRLLLGVSGNRVGPADVTVSPVPVDSRGRVLLVAEPRWFRGRQPRWSRVGAQCERLLAILLRAHGFAFRTVEASPGEDQMLAVRLPAGLFPLIGTQPGMQVVVEWGPGNRTVATALTAHEQAEEHWPQIEAIGRRRPPTPTTPSVALVSLGVNTRAALGIPRATVVTVRRRVAPLVVNKLNELIVPITGLFIALAVNAKLHAWKLILAVVIILGLLLLPLRMRRNPRGRVR
jgi:hypothetical protein